MNDDGLQLRTMPHSIEAERAVLGAVLLHANHLHAVLDIIKPADLFRKAHQTILEAAARLAERGVEVDLLTLKEILGPEQTERVGGPAYIASLVDGVPHSTNVEHYARIVKQKAQLRAIVQAGMEMVDAAYESDEDPQTVIDRAEQSIFEISTGTDRGGFRSIGDIVVNDTLPLIEKWHQNKGGLSGVPSGLTDFDERTGGFQPGELIIIAGRPGMGKTSLVSSIGKAAARAGFVVANFSLEMGRTELAVREISGEAHIDGRRIRRGWLGNRDWANLGAAVENLVALPLYIDDTADVSVWEMRSRLRRLKLEKGLDLVLIDYIQLMSENAKPEHRVQELTKISRALKVMAKALGVPIIALSQLSREADKRSDHHPILSDLRESGSLEQDADMVVFIYREAAYGETEENKRKAELIIAKQRSGPIGTVDIAWIPEETRFANAEQSYVDRQLPMGDR